MITSYQCPHCGQQCEHELDPSLRDWDYAVRKMPNQRRRLLLCSALVVLVGSVCAAYQAVTITWSVPGEYMVSGYVLNILEAPLQNARIDIGDRHAFTDLSGHYSFSNITGGSITVLARAIGYRDSSNISTINSDILINFTLKERRDPLVVFGD